MWRVGIKRSLAENGSSLTIQLSMRQSSKHGIERSCNRVSTVNIAIHYWYAQRSSHNVIVRNRAILHARGFHRVKSCGSTVGVSEVG